MRQTPSSVIYPSSSLHPFIYHASHNLPANRLIISSCVFLGFIESRATEYLDGDVGHGVWNTMDSQDEFRHKAEYISMANFRLMTELTKGALGDPVH